MKLMFSKFSSKWQLYYIARKSMKSIDRQALGSKLWIPSLAIDILILTMVYSNISIN